MIKNKDAIFNDMLNILIKHYKVPLSIYNRLCGMLGEPNLNLSTIECEITEVIEKASGKSIVEIMAAYNEN